MNFTEKSKLERVSEIIKKTYGIITDTLSRSLYFVETSRIKERDNRLFVDGLFIGRKYGKFTLCLIKEENSYKCVIENNEDEGSKSEWKLEVGERVVAEINSNEEEVLRELLIILERE